MRILITNDDSVSSPVLVPLIKWAMTKGEVTVCVPKVEQSAMSHAIQLRRAFEVKPIELVKGAECYTVDSTPADCVRFGHLGLKKDYDLIISGINKGYNMGQDIIYSGTVAAVMEGAYLGMRGLSLSTDIDCFDDALAHLDEVWQYITDNDLYSKHILYNVNIPPHSKGIKPCSQGGAFYTDSFEPIGNNMYQPKGYCVFQDSQDESIDTVAVMHGYISITPLSLDRTQRNILNNMM